MSDRTQIKLRIDITYDDVLRMFNEVEQKIRNEVVKLLPYPDVKLILSFCLHKTVDDMYVIIIKYKADDVYVLYVSQVQVPYVSFILDDDVHVVYSFVQTEAC